MIPTFIKDRVFGFVYGGSLSQQAMRGSAWLMSGRVALQLSGLIRLAIVARFVPPSEFGLMAVVLIVLQALEAFTTPGFNQALIQRRGSIEALFPTVFTASVLRGLFLGALIFLVAPFVAEFFGQSDSVEVVQAAAVILILRGFQSPALANVHRNLRYKAHFVWDLTSTAAALATALVLLLVTQSVWVLLVALIIEELVRSLGSFVIAPWCPKFGLVWQEIIELNRFGKWVVVGSIVVFLSLQLDSIAIGRLMDAESLGIYQLALRISQLPATQISQVVATVAYPTLSRLFGQSKGLRSAYLRMFTGLILLNLFVSGTMVALAEPMISFGFGNQWESAVPSLRILAIAGLVRSIVTVGGKVFYAVGRPKYDSLMNALRLMVLSLIIVPLVQRFGIEGASVAVLVSISCVLPVYMVLVGKVIDVRPREHFTYPFFVFQSAFGRMRRVPHE